MRPLNATVVLAAFALAACGSSTGGAAKAGAPQGSTVLRLASASGSIANYPSVRVFADAVRRRSGGRLTVRVETPYGSNADDAERQVVRGVAAHDIDLGYVHTGVFDTFGVTSLRALSAPLLITSYGLEARVVRSELPAAMLVGVRRLGVTGLAVLADQMRRPFGVAGPLRGPADYRGLTFAVYPSRTEAAALAALGARSTNHWGGALMRALADGSVGGFERTLRIYEADAMAGIAPYVTTNVNLWPQTLALIASPATLRRLNPGQRRWIDEAVADARAQSIALARTDAAPLAGACQTGGRVVHASTAEIAALRARFAPLYDDLERDPETRGYFARIRALGATTPAEPPLATPAGCTGNPPLRAGPTGRPEAIDGIYRWTLTKADKKRASNYDPAQPPVGDDTFTLRLSQGRWQARVVFDDGSPDENDHGTYRVQGDRVTWTLETAGLETDTFRFRVSHGQLTLFAFHGDPGDRFVMTAKPWRRIG